MQVVVHPERVEGGRLLQRLAHGGQLGQQLRMCPRWMSEVSEVKSEAVHCHAGRMALAWVIHHPRKLGGSQCPERA